eukprot:649652-Rhodomonas_salina.4
MSRECVSGGMRSECDGVPGGGARRESRGTTAFKGHRGVAQTRSVGVHSQEANASGTEDARRVCWFRHWTGPLGSLHHSLPCQGGSDGRRGKTTGVCIVGALAQR